MQDKPSPAQVAIAPVLPGKPSGFRSLVGYRTAVWRENYAEIELDLGPEHGNSIGVAHGGVAMTLLDAAMGHATCWCSVEGNVRGCVTISLTTTFLSPGRGGRITAVARLIGIENRIGTCVGEVFDESGGLIAAGQGSFRYFPGSERVEGVPRRPRDEA